MGAYNFIYNFRILFGKLTGCNELTKKLMEKLLKAETTEAYLD